MQETYPAARPARLQAQLDRLHSQIVRQLCRESVLSVKLPTNQCILHESGVSRPLMKYRIGRVHGMISGTAPSSGPPRDLPTAQLTGSDHHCLVAPAQLEVCAGTCSFRVSTLPVHHKQTYHPASSADGATHAIQTAPLVMQDCRIGAKKKTVSRNIRGQSMLYNRVNCVIRAASSARATQARAGSGLSIHPIPHSRWCGRSWHTVTPSA